ncbi:two component transcriptional regulator, LytTR family [Niabella drilacis]|uniref:Two component transcriptional regulator, LytTR family n=2 Tax=Niabella drilacis (strain DSM 25811 / CCM 8410 / CCUG 62505 / LMG 26954 / E90) TaxID=1285928 RepID=A0A1G6S8C5_NIADE|nr:two component transcriptional regulator, LytTR family [Niabella drilacis]
MNFRASEYAKTNMKTILLVEDDFLNRRLSKKILIENGYRVLEAKNAKEALETLKKEQINLAILDINLGEDEQDGISLGQQIKDRYAAPFIYVTAYDNSEVINRAVATTPYSYLTKPFKNVDMIASVEVAIRQSGKKHIPKIPVKDGDYTTELPIDEINYIESDGNYLLFHTDNKIYKTRSTIKRITEELSGKSFVQAHRAYIVNKNKISKFTSKTVMIGEAVIPVSENFAENIAFYKD